MVKVVKVKANYELKGSIMKVVEPLGGFKAFVKKGETVLLKPNFNTADPFPASTDLGFLKTIVGLCYDQGAKLVMVGDSSTMSLNTRKVMEEKNIFSLEKLDRPARVYVFDERDWVTKKISDGKYLKKACITEYLDKADKLILLPCLKTHFKAEFTASLKLSIGFLKPRERIGLHIRKIEEKIAELNTLIYPDLIIMDARKCFITGGPEHGELREPKTILASTDRVAIDIEGIKIIQSFEGNNIKGKDPWKFPQIKRAVDLEIGAKNEDDYQIIEG
ncbi:MAG: DUF362 domain-containing protein [Patescibacteria group bacterium]|nr:DUF362 domain-containing protein [Patescibacteria group bacterium]